MPSKTGMRPVALVRSAQDLIFTYGTSRSVDSFHGWECQLRVFAGGGWLFGVRQTRAVAAEVLVEAFGDALRQ